MPNPFVRRLENFEPLARPERQALLGATDTADVLDAGTIIMREGERTRRTPVILKGVACRYKLLSSGARQILDFLLPGDLCNGPALASHEMDHSVATLSDCVVAQIELKSLAALAAAHARITRALWWSALVEESVARERIVNVGRRSAEGRVAHLLSEIFMRLRAVRRARANGFDLPISQTDLADAAALSPIHVNRILRKLRVKQMLVLERRLIRVTDAQRLMAMAGFNPAYLHLKRNNVR